METRTLGRGGPPVSVIAFGAWPISGRMGEVDDDEAIEAVRAAVDSGQTFIDTAEAYLASETIVGRALAAGDYKERAFIATKVSGDYTREHMTRAIENSLQALRIDCVDLYQIHSPQTPPPIEEQLEVMHQLREQGKIRYIGVSNYGVEDLEAAWKVGPLHSVQPRYHMFDRHIEKEILPWCREHGVAILAHSPLGKGLLTGKYGPEHRFRESDERYKLREFQGETFQRSCAAVEKLKPIAEKKGLTLAQLAIGWPLRLPEVTVCLVGARNRDQVLENNGGQGWTFSADELTEIEVILEQ